MKYIDKNPLRGSFNEYTRAYLHEAYSDGTFIPKLNEITSYANFRAKKYFKTSIPIGSEYEGWLDILLKEHNGRCCYCMRRIEREDVSVEHLVPESLPEGREEEEYQYYANYAPEIRTHVMTGNAFDKLVEETDVDIDLHVKMPHLIAHSNLFPACNTKEYACSCNNHRGNKRILPLMLMPDIEHKVEYTEQGLVELLYPETTDMSVKNTIDALDINSNHLQAIRKLWYKFSRKGIYMEWNDDISFDKMDSLIRQALDLAPYEVIPLEYQDFTREDGGSLKNFSLFLKYNWFYSYYSNKYPINPQV